MKGLRHPATVIAALALFVALGGSSLAAASFISGRHIKPHSIPRDRLTKSAIKALRGAKGPRGAQGVQGVQGVQGAQGVQGIQGMPGLSGYTVVTSTHSASANDIGATVACPSGTHALGGGGEVLSGTSDIGPFLTDSQPANGGWLVEYSMAAAGNFPLSVEVYAICATVSS
jgi:hypothetical protein